MSQVTDTNATGNIDSKPATAIESGGEAEQDQALRERAAAREIEGGKATSLEREAMFRDLEGVGESGSQGSTLGREDQNPTTVGSRQR